MIYTAQMSYQFAPHTLFDAQDVNWDITATAWRGAVLEVFARADVAVDECIAALSRAGRDLGAQAHDRDVANRMRALARFLEAQNFSGPSRACIATLAQWCDDLPHRDLLARGAVSLTRDGVQVRLRRFGGDTQPKDMSASYSRLEMLVLLKRLGQSQLLLAQQLSQIMADARTQQS